MAAMSRPAPAGGAGTAHSRVVSHVPPAVYQTNIIDGVQDSSSQMEVRIALSDAAYISMRMHEGDLHEQVLGGLRRFDNHPIELYDPADGLMKVVKLHPSMFTYNLDHTSAQLVVAIHRKYLPVSKAHSDAPMKFVWLFMCVGEVVATTPFTVGSKEPRAAATPRPPPRRVRAPSTRKPFMALPDELDAAIDKVLRPTRGTKRAREAAEPTGGSDAASDVSDVPGGAAEEGMGVASPAKLARLDFTALPQPPSPPPPVRGESGGSLGPTLLLPVDLSRMASGGSLGPWLPFPPAALDVPEGVLTPLPCLG